MLVFALSQHVQGLNLARIGVPHMWSIVWDGFTARDKAECLVLARK